MKPLQVVFPARADPESPVIDLDLHLPLLCFRPEKVLQVRPPCPPAPTPEGLLLTGCPGADAAGTAERSHTQRLPSATRGPVRSECCCCCLKPTGATAHAAYKLHFFGVGGAPSSFGLGRQSRETRAGPVPTSRPRGRGRQRGQWAAPSDASLRPVRPQVLTCLLTEQRVVFFSASWALLTLVAECFLVYLHPLRWQHTFVPVLSGQMLDFVMAPTSFLMGCHLRHFDEVSQVSCRPCAGSPTSPCARGGGGTQKVSEVRAGHMATERPHRVLRERLGPGARPPADLGACPRLWRSELPVGLLHPSRSQQLIRCSSDECRRGGGGTDFGRGLCCSLFLVV